MKPNTLAALKESIRHWEENLAETDVSAIATGDADCALCQLFLENDCRGCPVKMAGFRNCRSSTETLSTWSAARNAYGKLQFNQSPNAWAAWQSACAAELAFLRSLLPEGEAA